MSEVIIDLLGSIINFSKQFIYLRLYILHLRHSLPTILPLLHNLPSIIIPSLILGCTGICVNVSKLWTLIPIIMDPISRFIAGIYINGAWCSLIVFVLGIPSSNWTHKVAWKSDTIDCVFKQRWSICMLSKLGHYEELI